MASKLRISGKARLAGVLGWPVAHSRSPALHNHWFERYAVDGVYVPLPVAPGHLEGVVRALPRMGFLGFNVTLPHKTAMLDLVDGLAPEAAAIGAVNTVLVDEAGRTTGHNTDGGGFLAHLDASVPGWRGRAGRAMLLGAGGAARAVGYALATAGVKTLVIVNRTRPKADALAQGLSDLTAARTMVVEWGEWARALDGCDLLVNTTSLGMAEQPPLALDLTSLSGAAVVADIVYTPLETELLAKAKGLGLETVDGLGMLLHQAMPGFRHWGGVTPAVDEAVRRLILGGN